MPQLTLKHAVRVYDEIGAQFGKADAAEFADKLSISQSADYIRKFKWAEDVCAFLEEKYSEEELKILRMSCSCKAGDKHKEESKKIFEISKNLDEFCEKYNKTFTGHTVWQEHGNLFLAYPTCYCSCVKRVPEKLPKTWCYCSLGYVKDLFDFIFSRNCEVELLESVKLGNSRCVMKILGE